MSARSTSAAPRTPRPAALIARAAARRSSDRLTVVRWVDESRRTWSKSAWYWVAAQPPSLRPCVSHQSLWLRAGSGIVASSTCRAAHVPDCASWAMTRPQRLTLSERSGSSSSANAG